MRKRTQLCTPWSSESEVAKNTVASVKRMNESIEGLIWPLESGVSSYRMNESIEGLIWPLESGVSSYRMNESIEGLIWPLESGVSSYSS